MDMSRMYPKTFSYISEIKDNSLNYVYCDTDAIKSNECQDISGEDIKKLPYHIVDISTGRIIG